MRALAVGEFYNCANGLLVVVLVLPMCSLLVLHVYVFLWQVYQFVGTGGVPFSSHLPEREGALLFPRLEVWLRNKEANEMELTYWTPRQSKLARPGRMSTWPGVDWRKFGFRMAQQLAQGPALGKTHNWRLKSHAPKGNSHEREDHPRLFLLHFPSACQGCSKHVLRMKRPAHVSSHTDLK